MRSMEPKKLLMIVNPRAGRNKSRGPLFDAAAIFSQAGYLLSIHNTTAQPGDAASAAASAGDYDMVAAVGGDGTLNEVVSGLMTLEHPPLLGYLPRGSTNDFASSLHLSGKPAEAAALYMWHPSGPLPAVPIPPPRPPKTPWATLPIFWRA